MPTASITANSRASPKYRSKLADAAFPAASAAVQLSKTEGTAAVTSSGGKGTAPVVLAPEDPVTEVPEEEESEQA